MLYNMALKMNDCIHVTMCFVTQIYSTPWVGPAVEDKLLWMVVVPSQKVDW